jgi:glycosyltransferase involved in cell wall biosynthesis
MEVARHLSRLLWYPVRRIPVIPNGTDIPDLTTFNRNKLRARHGWQESDFVVGYVGRFAQHKGHAYFLQVMQYTFAKLGYRLKICFVGDGPGRKDIEKAVHHADLHKQVLFAGIVANVSDYYAAFDCTALLSAYEGMPNVVIEAMAFALPVIANPVGNTAELLAGDCGLVNQHTDPEETAKLFLELANKPALRQYFGQNARKKIEAEFSVEKIVNLLFREYGFSQK